MQSPHREPLTAEWSTSGGTPRRDALLRDPDQLQGQHGSTGGQDPEPEPDELNNNLRTESSPTSTSASVLSCTTLFAATSFLSTFFGFYLRPAQEADLLSHHHQLLPSDSCGVHQKPVSCHLDLPLHSVGFSSTPGSYAALLLPDSIGSSMLPATLGGPRFLENFVHV